MFEIAARLGTGAAYGIDPWRAALERARRKAKTRALANVQLHEGVAEALPLADRTVDLIVSNNGINNVADLDRALAECWLAIVPEEAREDVFREVEARFAGEVALEIPFACVKARRAGR